MLLVLELELESVTSKACDMVDEASPAVAGRVAFAPTAGSTELVEVSPKSSP
jgi:hypothetical protein